MPKTRIKGFTLLELLVSIAVLAILASITVPSYRRWRESSAIQASTNELVATLHFARTKAVERDRSILVCPKKKHKTSCGGHWNNGWIVHFKGNKDNPIQVHQRKSKQAQFVGWNGDIVEFDPNGFARGNNGSFSVVGKNYRYKTCVILSETGRIRTVSGNKKTKCNKLHQPYQP